MILDGESGGPYHKWQLVTPVLKRELEETGLFQVDVVTAPKSGEDFSAFKPEFTKYDVIVSNYDAPDWPADLRASFEQYISNGGGLVTVHAADNAFGQWLEYNKMIGIGEAGANATKPPVRCGFSATAHCSPTQRPAAPERTARAFLIR